jgi:tRNA modification GTPase
MKTSRKLTVCSTSEETIVAISTPPGRSGIGVIRLSGPEALTITERIFRPGAGIPLAPRTATFGEICEPHTNDIVDQAVVTFFKGPHSYTGEDSIEISCHGSPVILRRVLDIILECGARAAGPGEFTMRAFFNGRMDLTQAEALRDLIEAQTIYQARVALRQVQGSLSQLLQPLKQSLVEIIVQLETAVEFVEDDVTTETLHTLSLRLDTLASRFAEIERSFRVGRVIREGIQLAIVGKPNVGKSSLFNRLLQKERAIVTEIPGTTRDALVDAASIGGVPVSLVDTAGIRHAVEVVEKIGIQRSRQAIADADLVLVVLDASQPLDQDDLTVLQETDSLPRLIVVNKTDLEMELTAELLQPTVASPAVHTSALIGTGIEELQQEILAIITSRSAFQPEDVILTNARHHRLIVEAKQAIEKAQAALSEGYSEEVALVELHNALRAVGEITGEVTIEDLLDQIFSTFCIGK